MINYDDNDDNDNKVLRDKSDKHILRLKTRLSCCEKKDQGSTSFDEKKGQKSKIRVSSDIWVLYMIYMSDIYVFWDN